MTAGDWINLFSAAFAGLAVLLPFFFKRFEKRDRLSRVTYLINLIKARQELSQLTESARLGAEPKDISIEASRLLNEVDEEIATPTEIARYGLFIAAAFVEAVLFIGAAFTELSQWYKNLFLGKSFESGFFFLEGVFGYPAARIFLLVVCIILAVVGSLKSVPTLSRHFRSYYSLNLALLGAFNIFLVIIIFVVSAVLAILDPIISIW
jgi:hypothetical protein